MSKVSVIVTSKAEITKKVKLYRALLDIEETTELYIKITGTINGSYKTERVVNPSELTIKDEWLNKVEKIKKMSGTCYLDITVA